MLHCLQFFLLRKSTGQRNRRQFLRAASFVPVRGSKNRDMQYGRLLTSHLSPFARGVEREDRREKRVLLIHGRGGSDDIIVVNISREREREQEREERRGEERGEERRGCKGMFVDYLCAHFRFARSHLGST